MPNRWAWCWPKRGVGEKEVELTVAPELLAQVKLGGRVVTGDALYAQKNLSYQVVEQGGDYFWVVKDNQPTLRADIALLFAEPPWERHLLLSRSRGGTETARRCVNCGPPAPLMSIWTGPMYSRCAVWNGG